MNLIHAFVSQLRETQALACGGCGGDGVRNQNHNILEISGYNYGVLCDQFSTSYNCKLLSEQLAYYSRMYTS